MHRSCALEVPDGHDDENVLKKNRRVVILSVATLLRHATQTCLPEPFTSHSLSRSVTGTCTLLASYAIDATSSDVDAVLFVRRHSYGDYTE